MPKKLTKAQARRRLNEIMGKVMNLFASGYLSMKDVETITRIHKFRTKQLK